MRGRCLLCERRRELRGGRACDECAEDWWFDRDGDRWLETGVTYADPDYPDPASARVALIAERRWHPTPPSYVPSALWDAGTPSTGV